MEMTQQYLWNRLNYDPLTGIFTWPDGHFLAGEEAGTVFKNGYRYISLLGSKYLMHRLAWLYVHGRWPAGHLDHINQARTDNQISNLREVTASENSRNQRRHSDNKTGITGVSWCCTWERWRAAIWTGTKQQSLGYFKDFFEACCARKSAEIANGYHPNHGSTT